MSNVLGIRFLFRQSNHHLDVPMEAYQVNKIIKQLKNGSIPEKIGDEDGNWVVDTREVSTAHAIIQENPQQYPSNAGYSVGPSGYQTPPRLN